MLFFRISTLLIFKKCGSRFDMDYSGLDCHTFPFIPGFLYPKIPVHQALTGKYSPDCLQLPAFIQAASYF